MVRDSSVFPSSTYRVSFFTFGSLSIWGLFFCVRYEMWIQLYLSKCLFSYLITIYLKFHSFFPDIGDTRLLYSFWSTLGFLFHTASHSVNAAVPHCINSRGFNIWQGQVLLTEFLFHCFSQYSYIFILSFEIQYSVPIFVSTENKAP